MKRLGSLFNTISAIIILVFSLSAWGADSPLSIIQASVGKTLTPLPDPSYQGPAHRQERLAKAEQVIISHFDTQEFARRALGAYWDQRSVAEQREFVEVFTALVARTYTDIIDRHAKGVKVFYDKQSIDGSDAEVDTRVLSPSEDQPVSVNYMMHRVNGQWLIYDIQVDNVSIVLNYRSQFNHFLSTSSYPDLIQTMRSKLREITAAS